MAADTPRTEAEPELTVELDEYNRHSRALVRLRWNGATVVGRGLSRLDVGDEVEHGIGQRLAVARALSHVMRQLFTDVANDIEAVSAPRSA